ncbi:MAG: SPOR domain-containing protein [Burkholderiaceae bacterium]|nr:SPOR domain-containing protein [Burkholderiaceae bacterium]
MARGAQSAGRGPMLLAFMAGLVLGLAIAVVVAIVVTQAPVPFLNKTPRSSEKTLELKLGEQLPDPNKPLGQSGAPAPGTSPVTTAPGAAPVAAPPPAAANAGDGTEKMSFMLQAGSYANQDAAEGVKAKLALIGFEASVVPAAVSGKTVYRVRVGPFAALEEMNQARARLAESGVEASAVRQR